MKREKKIVMIAQGGVGEFLFQLDLAKRLKMHGLDTVIFTKGKFIFFAQLIELSTVKSTELKKIGGKMLLLGALDLVRLCIKNEVILINSFNSLRFSLGTKIIYAVVKLFGGRVVISKKDKMEISCETVFYEEGEKIWQRNNRMVSYLLNKEVKGTFPLLFEGRKREVSVPYIHVHPVGSSLVKSYPPKKLISLFESMKDKDFFLTMTEGEAKWYLTPELKKYLDGNEKIVLQVKNFAASEIISIMRAAKVFCTVNTGLLWLSIMHELETVVVDTHTDPEWNPAPYDKIIRLAHDYDEKGESLHLVKKSHEDGTFFESMYLVTPEEIKKELEKFI